jgi:iron complex outermembrane receptor protein
VLTAEQLAHDLQPTLGETLGKEPGVSSTFFGMGASRPVIRGLGGDRIRVLESGVGVGDASSTSPDHAVSVDPAVAERIEVLRGPATLLYGSSAVGGVVNVIDDRIPESLPGQKITGTVELRGGSVADGRGGVASLSGGAGKVAWHLDYAKNETDDYEIPGFAESAILRASEEEEGEGHEEEEEIRDLLPNSATDTESGAIGASFIGESGFLGVAASGLDSLYGIPGGHAHEEGEGEEGEEEEEEGAVRIDLRQRRWDLRGGVTRPFGIFRGANLRFGTSDYEHVELEGEEIGTVFSNDAWEGRVELVQKQLGSLSGSVGLQVLSRDFEAIGAEAFVPPTRTDTWAVFAFEEIARGDWRIQLGGRLESQDVEAAAGEVRARSFDGLSGSLGLIRSFGDDYNVGLNLARSTKLPNAEELFSNGPHLATNAFEVGDPNLDVETSLGADLTLRKTSGRLTGDVTIFLNRLDDFIFEEATGEQEDGLQVFQFVNRDAELRGAELSGILQLYHGEPNHLDLELGADFVRGELRSTGEPLPRIPPRRYRLGLHYHGERWKGQIEGLRAEEQDRISAFELPTEGYTLVNASVGYRFFAGPSIVDVLLRGTNLTDEEARNHVSFLKDLVPLPGRDVSLALRVSF